ncbi:MAG: hypothetical protein MJ191_00260, partial [Clostridium sp.]|nr:hypothetical protein [Clostridium sp.]
MELYNDDFNSELKTNLHSMLFNISNWMTPKFLTTYNRDGFPVPYWFNLFNFTPINHITLSNDKVFLKQEHLDIFIKEDNEIPYPDFLDTLDFSISSSAPTGKLQFNFINTSTGKIIYKILDKFAAEEQTTGSFNFKLEKLEELSAAFKISNNHSISMYK